MTLSNQETIQVLSLSKVLKQAAIAKLVGCSQASVSNTINKYKKDEK